MCPVLARAVLVLIALIGPAVAAEVTIPGQDGAMLRTALFLPPEGAPLGRAVIIALHGCNGIGAAESPIRLAPRERNWTARLTAAGHPVLWPDSFGSRGLGPACGMGRTYPAPPATVRRADAHAAAAWAAAQPWSARGGAVVMGWSHGASTAIASLRDPPPGLIRATIAYYPGCGGFGPAFPAPAAPLLMLLGEADDWTSPVPCRRLAARFPDRITAIVYPGAGHGFDAPGGSSQARTLPDGRSVHVGREPMAAADSRLRVDAFLAAHGGPAPQN